MCKNKRILKIWFMRIDTRVLNKPCGFIICMSLFFAVLFSPVMLFGYELDPDFSRTIFAFPEIRPGLYVHLNCKDGGLIAELVRGRGLLVHGLVLDTAFLDNTRDDIKEQGIYGKASAQACNSNRLPYADNLVNLMVVDDVEETRDAGVSVEEMMRVVCPRGMALIGQRSGGALSQWELDGMLADAGITEYQIITENGLWAKVIKPFPPDMDEWTHFRHGADGNSVSQDSFAAPNTFKWIAGPHRKRINNDCTYYGNSSSLSVMANGRIYYNENNVLFAADVGEPVVHSIVARDANNGLLLWSRQISHTPSVSSVLAVGDTLFLPADKDGPLAGINGADGNIISTYPNGGSVREAIYNYGSLIVLCDGPQWKVRSVDVSSGSLNWTYSPQSGASICAATSSTPTNNRDMVIGEGRVFFFESQNGSYYVTCLDTADGTQLWRTANALWDTNPGISIYGGGVLAAGRNGTLYGISGNDGAMLWNYTYTMISRFEPNCFYVQGNFWIHHKPAGPSPNTGWGQWLGLNPAAGAVENSFFDGNETDRFRCSPYSVNKRFLMAGTMDFMDIKTQSHSSLRIARPGCYLGYIRGNDLMYTFPNACGCYPMVKGYIAMVHDSIAEDTTGRLEKGSAYSEIITDDMISNDEWPGFRHDSLRSCATPYPVDISNFQIHWQVRAGNSLGCVERDEAREELEILTCPVIAGGRVYVVSNGTNELRAYDAANGALLWSYALGARCDSPPTIYKGRCILGCNDGWIYCLRGSDGELIWRFRAARENKLLAVFGELESAWPVSGSGTIHGGNIHFIAGRHANDKRGLWMYAINPATGDVIWEKPVPSGSDVVYHGARSILVSDGKYLFMYKYLVNPANGNAYNWYGAEVTLKHKGIHLCGSRENGLLSCGIGYKEAGVWSFGSITNPIVKGYYHVFDTNRVFSMVYPDAFHSDQVCAYTYDTGGAVLQWEVSSPSALEHDKVQYIKTMLLAENHLFAAGALDEEDKNAGEVWIYSTIDGSKLGEFGIEAPPVFNGMAAAYGRLYISTKDGKLLCMSGEEPVGVITGTMAPEAANKKEDDSGYCASIPYYQSPMAAGINGREDNFESIKSNKPVTMNIREETESESVFMAIPNIKQNRIAAVPGSFDIVNLDTAWRDSTVEEHYSIVTKTCLPSFKDTIFSAVSEVSNMQGAADRTADMDDNGANKIDEKGDISSNTKSGHGYMDIVIVLSCAVVFALGWSCR
ncbi:MAG: PQQ-binding-like beta-propeller repeat protein [bacterium]